VDDASPIQPQHWRGQCVEKRIRGEFGMHCTNLVQTLAECAVGPRAAFTLQRSSPMQPVHSTWGSFMNLRLSTAIIVAIAVLPATQAAGAVSVGMIVSMQE
jgi:hypothetical protein